MITSLNFGYKANSDEYGYAVGDQAVPVSGQTLQIYIPSIMSGIEKSDKIEITKKAIKSANKIFVNASECRPKLKKTIKSKNAITAKMENNCSYPTTLAKIINGTRVDVNFPNDSLANIYFTNNIN